MARYIDFEYEKNNSSIKIKKYCGSAKFVNIPSQIENLPYFRDVANLCVENRKCTQNLDYSPTTPLESPCFSYGEEGGVYLPKKRRESPLL